MDNQPLPKPGDKVWLEKRVETLEKKVAELQDRIDAAIKYAKQTLDEESRHINSNTLKPYGQEYD